MFVKEKHFSDKKRVPKANSRWGSGLHFNYAGKSRKMPQSTSSSVACSLCGRWTFCDVNNKQTRGKQFEKLEEKLRMLCTLRTIKHENLSQLNIYFHQHAICDALLTQSKWWWMLIEADKPSRKQQIVFKVFRQLIWKLLSSSSLQKMLWSAWENICILCTRLFIVLHLTKVFHADVGVCSDVRSTGGSILSNCTSLRTQRVNRLRALSSVWLLLTILVSVMSAR